VQQHAASRKPIGHAGLAALPVDVMTTAQGRKTKGERGAHVTKTAHGRQMSKASSRENGMTQLAHAMTTRLSHVH